MKKLSNSERKNLRSQAHPLKPVVMIGQSGLTEAVLAEIDIALIPVVEPKFFKRMLLVVK